MLALLLHVGCDFGQVLDLDREGRIKHSQLLGVLDQVLHLAVLLLQRLYLEVALENLSLSCFLLRLETRLELVLGEYPLVEVAPQIPEISHLLVDSV